MGNNLYQYISSNDDKNIFLYAEGGFGKTTQLKFTEHALICRAEKEKIVPIYIDAKLLDESSEQPVYKYIIDTFNLDINVDVDSFFQTQYENYGYTFYLLLDSLNEAPYNLQKKIINNIAKLKNTSGIKIIVASRSVNGNELFNDFKKVKLNGITRKQIENYLTAHFEQPVSAEKFNESLIEILQTPLYLKAFATTCKGKSFPDLYSSNVVRKADLLNRYLDKLKDDLKTDNSILTNTKKTEFIVKYYLPAFAFKLAANGKLSFTNEEWKEISQELNSAYFSKFFDADEKSNAIPFSDEEISNGAILPILQNQIALIHKTGQRSTARYSMHQVWRDMLAAKHICNLINLSDDYSELEISVDKNVRLFAGELLKTKDNLCECDFESKTECREDNISPIEAFMQKEHKALNARPIAIRNLIEIMKTARNNKITAVYDKLDLTDVGFQMCTLSNSTFCGNRISKTCFNDYYKYLRIVSVIPQRNEFVTKSTDCNLRFFDINTAQQKYTLYDKLPELKGLSFKSIFFSKDMHRCLLIRLNKESDLAAVYFADLLTQEYKEINDNQTLSAFFKEDFRCFDIDSNQNIVFAESIDENKRCRINIFKNQNITHFEINRIVDCIAFSNDCKRFALSTSDGAVLLYDSETLTNIKSFNLLENTAEKTFGLSIGIDADIIFSEDDEYIYAFSKLLNKVYKISVNSKTNQGAEVVADTKKLRKLFELFGIHNGNPLLANCNDIYLCETNKPENDNIKEYISLPVSVSIQNDFQYNPESEELLFSGKYVSESPERLFCDIRNSRLIEKSDLSDTSCKSISDNKAFTVNNNGVFWIVEDCLDYIVNAGSELSKIPNALGGKEFIGSDAYRAISNNSNPFRKGSFFIGNDETILFLRKKSDKKYDIEEYGIDSVADGKYDNRIVGSDIIIAESFESFGIDYFKANSSKSKALLSVYEQKGEYRYEKSGFHHMVYLLDLKTGVIKTVCELKDCYTQLSFSNIGKKEIIQILTTYISLEPYSEMHIYDEDGLFISKNTVNGIPSFDDFVNNSSLAVSNGRDSLSLFDIENEKVLFKEQKILPAKIYNCDFDGADFDNDIDKEFLTTLYFNGAKISEEYKPKSYPFETREIEK